MKQEEMYNEMNEQQWIARQEELISGEMQLLGTKKEIAAQAEAWAMQIVDEETGSENLHKRYASIQRIKEYVDTVQSTFKKALECDQQEKHFECYGMKFSRVEGRSILDYSQDEKYQELKAKVKEREELLKVAAKSKEMIFDSEGVEVPRVPGKPSSAYIKIAY